MPFETRWEFLPADRLRYYGNLINLKKRVDIHRGALS